MEKFGICHTTACIVQKPQEKSVWCLIVLPNMPGYRSMMNCSNVQICNLVGVLLRFRSEQVAITSDVEAMFHQVHVPEADRDLLRFLWWPDGNLKAEPQEYRMTVHLFGATSSPS
jgi:hypothetical protein